MHDLDPYTLLGILTVSICVVLNTFRISNLRHIPTIGPSFPLLSCLGAIRFLLDSESMLQEGYDKYKEGLFKIADFNSWMVIVSKPQYIEDIRKAPLDVLKFEPNIDGALHALGPNIRKSHFHVPIVQNQLTRKLNDSFHEIRDEIITALDDFGLHSCAGWSRVSALDTILTVVCRTTHRVFVGLPLCRNPGYVSLTMQFAIDTSKAGSFIRLFPPWLKGVVGRPFADVPYTLQRIMEYLRPLVEERNDNLERFGKGYAGQPEDLLSWFMDKVDGSSAEEKLMHIAFHLLIVNFGAVYSTTMSTTQALYHLATHPECIEPLREEIRIVVSQEGWTKAALGNMRKLDSFLKESQRVTGLSAASAYRRVMKPFTFSDGTSIMPGTTIAIAAYYTHLDDSIYPDAKTFKPFRFSDMEGDSGHWVAPSANYLPFGVGRHLCPGRFFTAVTMKAIISHLILNYDVKLEKEGERPPNSWFITDNMPNGTAGILLRKCRT